MLMMLKMHCDDVMLCMYMGGAMKVSKVKPLVCILWSFTPSFFSEIWKRNLTATDPALFGCKWRSDTEKLSLSGLLEIITKMLW